MGLRGSFLIIPPTSGEDYPVLPSAFTRLRSLTPTKGLIYAVVGKLHYGLCGNHRPQPSSKRRALERDTRIRPVHAPTRHERLPPPPPLPPLLPTMWPSQKLLLAGAVSPESVSQRGENSSATGRHAALTTINTTPAPLPPRPALLQDRPRPTTRGPALHHLPSTQYHLRPLPPPPPAPPNGLSRVSATTAKARRRKRERRIQTGCVEQMTVLTPLSVGADKARS